MARLRRDAPEIQPIMPVRRPLRIVASGTLFLTHTLSLPVHPTPGGAIRAHSVEKMRGGSASTVLSILSQFSNVDSMLVASLGGNEEGKMILRDLDREGVNTRFCKIWENYGVPSAWVMHSAETDSRTVINHNPLPDITHEEFIGLLGPILAPENYYYPSPVPSPTSGTGMTTNAPAYPPISNSSLTPPSSAQFRQSQSPAPFDWLHVEGRSVKTTLSNVIGLDGLARERKWRSHCVFSLDVGRKGRQGVEALIPHADVIFLNKHYAKTHSPHYATTPRAFLLSLTQIAPPHALLVAHWGSEGSAVLSLPTREYFQSSGWVEENNQGGNEDTPDGQLSDGVESVRSGSTYWAGAAAMGHTPSSSAAFTAFTAGESSFASPSRPSRRRMNSNSRESDEDDNDNDSQGTETPRQEDTRDDDVEGIDEIGAQDAFVAGMIYALSRKIMPGEPYFPTSVSRNESARMIRPVADDRQRWRLDECLRFATELSGRKARRRGWEGLANEMTRAGWFD